MAQEAPSTAIAGRSALTNRTDGFILLLPSIRVGAWRLVVIPGDHEPRHVHARYGSAEANEVVVEIDTDGAVKLRRANRALSRAQVRRALELVTEHRADLMQLWETYC